MTAPASSTSPSKPASDPAKRRVRARLSLKSALLGLMLVPMLGQGTPLMAQGSGLSLPQVPSGIAVLNQERLYSQSLWGQRVQGELEEASAELLAENRQIESELNAEEQRLTELRAEMSAEDFAPLAEEFDQNVRRIRAEQDAKLRELQALADQAQQLFFESSSPILLDLVSDMGAAAIIDARVVIYLVEGVDITEAALIRINAELGDGGEQPILEQLRPEPEAE